MIGPANCGAVSHFVASLMNWLFETVTVPCLLLAQSGPKSVSALVPFTKDSSPKEALVDSQEIAGPRLTRL